MKTNPDLIPPGLEEFRTLTVRLDPASAGTLAQILKRIVETADPKNDDKFYVGFIASVSNLIFECTENPMFGYCCQKVPPEVVSVIEQAIPASVAAPAGPSRN